MVVQVCFPMHLYEKKKHLKILFSKTEDALWLNLCIYYWEHLHVCSGYVTQVSEPWPVGLLFLFLSKCYHTQSRSCDAGLLDLFNKQSGLGGKNNKEKVV